MSKKALLEIWLLPFRLITLWSMWATRKIGRKFIGSGLKISPKGDWKRLPSLPSYRYEFGSATVDNKIYVIGGIIAPSVYFPTNISEVYDVKSRSWSKTAPHPKIIHHPGVVSDEKNIYVIGGNGIRIISYRYNYRYDPQLDVWTRLPDMPSKRCALGLAYWKGKIYAVGGGDNKHPLSVFEEYDTATQIWRKLPDMPTPREHLFAVAAQGKIFAMGGYQWDRFHNLNTMEIYDIKSNKWTQAAPLPAKISGFTAAVWGNSIYVFGGEQGWSVSKEVYEYQIVKDRWRRRKDLPRARYASGCATSTKGIHVIGGNTYIHSHYFSQDHDIFNP